MALVYSGAKDNLFLQIHHLLTQGCRDLGGLGRKTYALASADPRI